MKKKPLEELTFIDDYMFGAVMHDPEICKGVIERLLHIEVHHIEYPELQKAIKATYESKGIRLDVYVNDGTKLYDIEMQNNSLEFIGKRTRYYQSLIDVDTLLSGETYKNLKESYILFICKNDPFGKRLQQYSFNTMCKEDCSVQINDFSHKIIYNASAYKNEHDEELKSFLHFVCTNQPTDSFTKMLTKTVEKIKQNERFRTEYMAVNIHDQDIFDEGKETGEHNKALESAAIMINKFKLSIDDVCLELNLSKDEVTEFLKSK